MMLNLYFYGIQINLLKDWRPYKISTHDAHDAHL